MQKEELVELVSTLVPSEGWPGAPNNLRLQNVLQNVVGAIFDASGASESSVATIDDTDSPYDVEASVRTLLVDASADNVVINLPPGEDVAGRFVTVVVVDQNSNSITLVPADGNTVVNSGAIDLTVANNSVTLVCDGTDFYVTSLVDFS